MDTATLGSCVPVDTVTATRPNDTLTQMVRHVAAFQRPGAGDRRQLDRTPLPFLLRLVPLDDDGRALVELATVVVGRDVSPRGISFFHNEPFPHRRALITLDHPCAGRLTIEIDISRCRFHKLGWYESGGRLVQPVELMLPAKSQAG